MAPRLNGISQPQPGNILPIEAEEKASTTANVSAIGADIDDGAGIIPFRTSKRLQGAIYRMIQERGNRFPSNDTPAKAKHSSSSSRSLKRQHLPSAQIDLNQAVPEVCEYESSTTSSAEEVTCRKKRTKSSTVRFADPLFIYIEERTDAVPSSRTNQRPVSKDDNLQARKVHLAGKVGVQSTDPLRNDAISPSSTDQLSVYKDDHLLSRKVQPAGKAGVQSTEPAHDHQQNPQRPPPMSCFDLLCNHVGPRGWRCYRSSVEGKSFCSYHQSRTAASFEHSRMSRTICT